MKIFHHNDADGYAAGYLVKKFFNKEKPELIEMDYSKKFPIDIIKEDELIYIVDFSIEPKDMVDLLRITKRVYWIDHHISAINKYNEWQDIINEVIDNPIKGLRFDGISGCALTWLYLYMQINEHEIMPGIKYSEKQLRNYFEDAPMWLKLIDDWDVWRHKLKDTKAFMIALNTVLSIKTIERLDRDAIDNNYINVLIELGENYIIYRNRWSEQLRDRYGFDTFIKGPDDSVYSMYCLNLGNANSEYFGDKIEQFDICTTFCFNGTKFNYSMYSNKDYVDCSELCKYYGGMSEEPNGGGHKGAAGFIHEDMLFRHMI